MKRILVAVCIFVCIIYRSESLCDSNDTVFSNSSKISIWKNTAQSLLLPSYASYKSENYILSSFQACLDLLPFYIMATQDLRGEGALAILSFPIFWGFNRLSAIPLNALSVFIHNYRIEKGISVRYLPSFSDKACFGLIAAFGSDNSIPVDNAGIYPGIELKYGKIRMMTFISGTFTYSEEYSSVYMNDGEIINVKYAVKNHVISSFDYRIRIQKSMCINPGIAFDLFKSRYSYFRCMPPGGEKRAACIPLHSFEKNSYFICPKASWEITRFNRFTIEHTIAFPFAVEHNLRSYYRKTNKVPKKIVYTFSMNVLLF